MREEAEITGVGRAHARHTIDTLIDTSRPATAVIGKVYLYARGFGKLPMRRHFTPIIMRHRKAFLRFYPTLRGFNFEANEISVILIRDIAFFYRAAEAMEVAFQGKVASHIFEGQTVFNLVARYPKKAEETTGPRTSEKPSTEMRLSPDQTSALVEPAGFALETVVELPPYHFGAIFVLSRE